MVGVVEWYLGVYFGGVVEVFEVVVVGECVYWVWYDVYLCCVGLC